MPSAEQMLEWARIREEILSAWARGEALTEMRIRVTPGGKRNALGEYFTLRSLQNYARRIYRELDVNNATTAVAEAYRRGFLPCPCSGPVRASDVRRYEGGEKPSQA